MRVYSADLPYRCATFALSRIGRGPKGGETAVRREMGLWSNPDAKRVSCLHLSQMIQWPDFFQTNPGLAIQIQIVSITWDVKITFPSLDVCLNKVTSFIGCFHFFWEAFGSDEREAAGRMRRESLIGILCCTSEDMRHIFLVFFGWNLSILRVLNGWLLFPNKRYILLLLDGGVPYPLPCWVLSGE